MTKGTWYEKRALKVNFNPLTWSVPEIFSKNYKKAILTLTPSSSRTGKLNRVRSTSRESPIR